MRLPYSRYVIQLTKHNSSKQPSMPPSPADTVITFGGQRSRSTVVTFQGIYTRTSPSVANIQTWGVDPEDDLVTAVVVGAISDYQSLSPREMKPDKLKECIIFQIYEHSDDPRFATYEVYVKDTEQREELPSCISQVSNDQGTQ